MHMKLGHSTRVLVLTLLGGLPALLLGSVLIMNTKYEGVVRWTAIVLLTIFWLICAFAVRHQVGRSLRTISSLLEAMREGDYSIRGRVGAHREPMSDVMQQINSMASTLRDERLGAVEATTLLRKVMEEIDVAAFAFDPQHALKLVNRAGERLLAQPAETLLGCSAASLQLSEYLDSTAERTIQHEFPGGPGRWSIRVRSFRELGMPHQLLVITDLTRALREEELQAWQRIVRVLGHELNNSLTPVKSIAQSLGGMLRSDPKPDDWAEDMEHGLEIIAMRSESLSRLFSNYARLARMPALHIAPVDVQLLLTRVAALETRLQVTVESGPPNQIQADADQLEQALINLVRNAVEATLESGGRVTLKQQCSSGTVDIIVRDEGHGLTNTTNLFVPFFTTKRGGSGIGLILSRQIVEAHRGFLTVENSREGPGCEARISLPS